MAERRAGPFPVDGEVVLARDGTAWLYADGAWEELYPGLSHEESERAQAHERDVRARLARALAVWVQARETCPVVKGLGPDMRKGDPLPCWVELVTRAALEDCIAETCDGSPLGQEMQCRGQVAALLGTATYVRLNHAVQRLRFRFRRPPLPSSAREA